MKHNEDSIQIAAINYFRVRHKNTIYPVLFHVPNGGVRSKAAGAKFKCMGVKAGVSDLILPVPRGPYGSLFVELKTDKPRGKVSKNQNAWIKLMNESGNLAVVAYGFKECVAAIEDYWNLEPLS